MTNTPENYDRRHAVSEAQELAWAGQLPPRLTIQERPFKVVRSLLSISNKTSYWVPQTAVKYAPILDHGIRSVTHGVVMHVNDGYAKGTESFFTNGLREPYGSEGVGAHFEMCGKPGSGLLEDTLCTQFLPLNRVAWHAVDANDTTIGIEHAGFGYTTYEWEHTHYNMIGNSAYRTAWILHRFNLGPPDISLTNPNRGNIWQHKTGGASWGGHICTCSTKDGRDYFPWDMFETWCKKAYNNKWQWK